MTKGKICELHQSILQPLKVKIIYGFWLPEFKYQNARERMFPNSKKFITGGCDIRDAKYMEALVCISCREAEARWEEKRKRKQGIELEGKETEKRYVVGHA
jgi:hypothetical protein